MKKPPQHYEDNLYSPQQRYRHVIGIEFSDTSAAYFTSSSSAFVPAGVAAADRYDSVIVGITSQSQRFDFKTATSSIGSLKVKLADLNGDISARLKAELDAGNGLRGKKITYWNGFDDAASFDDYLKQFTYVIDSVVDYRDGVYTLQCSSVHRFAKRTIFSMDKGSLTGAMSETDMTIPVAIGGPADKFKPVYHTAASTDNAGQTLGYVRIEDEVIAHSGWTDGTYTALQVVERGALSTRPAAHEFDASKPIDVTEYTYAEMPLPKLLYALLTGEIHGTSETLPAHWTCAVDPAYVDLDSFLNIGEDIWDGADGGKIIRVIGEDAQNAKKFIEEQILRWLPGLLSMNADGQFTLRRLQLPLPYADYQYSIGDGQIVSFSALTENEREVVNNISIEWGWIDVREKFSKKAVMLDTYSAAKYGQGDPVKYQFRTVFPGLHADTDLQIFFDQLRNRYSSPPLTWQLTVTPDCMLLEHADVVRVSCSTVQDFRSDSALDRSFEIRGVKTDWINGLVTLDLFGATEPAQPISVSGDYVMDDAAYDPATNGGTDLASVLSISNGSVTADGTLTGNATDWRNAIYTYQGDLTIPDGVTVSVTNNVALFIKGTLLINGKISGVGGGMAGRLSSSDTTYAGIPADPPVDLTTRSMSGSGLAITDHTANGVNVIPLITKALFYGIDYDVKFQSIREAAISNPDGLSVEGVPSDLRGVGGGNGGGVYSSPSAATVATGGDGGKGAAGLFLLVRGMSFGASGEVDLRGSAGTQGGTATENGVTAHAGSGVPGGPGHCIVRIDGAAALPDYSRFNMGRELLNVPTSVVYDPEVYPYKPFQPLTRMPVEAGLSVKHRDFQGYYPKVIRNAVDTHLSMGYMPLARNGYRWFPADEAAVTPGYGEPPPTWTEIVDDGKKPEDNANLVTGTSQLSDDANLSGIKHILDGEPQPDVESNISILVDNGQSSAGWYKVASCRLPSSYDSWNFHGVFDWGASGRRFDYQARVSIAAKTGSTAALYNGEKILASTPDETAFSDRLRMYRTDNGDGTFTWTLYVKLPAWASARLRGVFSIGGTSVTESWYKESHVAADSLGSTYTPSGTQIAATFNYQPGADVTSDNVAAGINGQGALATKNTVGTPDIEANAVNNDKIAPDAVTGTEIATNAVGNDNIAPSAVDTPEIAAGAVSTLAWDSDNTDWQPISGSTSDFISITVTTTGKPVFLDFFVYADKDYSTTYFSEVFFTLYRGSTQIANSEIYLFKSGSGPGRQGMSIQFVDSVAAGTYTYTLKGYVLDGGGILHIKQRVARALELKR